MTITDLAARLKGVRKKSNGGFMAVCPAHNDRDPSLSVDNGQDGRIVLKCMSGCAIQAVCGAIGIEEKDLFNDRAGPSAKPRIVATYDYRDGDGALLFQVCRFEPKNFRQRRPNGNGGWIWNMAGVKRVPYRLPEWKDNPTVYITEGEKDADALWKLGLPATCNPMGAGKWRAEYNPYFIGKDVTIIPDNDPPGQDHARDVAGHLLGSAALIRILNLPGLQPKGDVSDWIAAGGTGAKFAQLLAECPEVKQSDLREQTQPETPHQFEVVNEGRYRLTVPDAGTRFEVDRVRRERGELIGELAVSCELPGARVTADGSLSIADFNLSSARARSDRAKLLMERSRAAFDWPGLLEELCQRVLQAERTGQPAVDLREMPSPGPDDSIQIAGLALPRRHPTILFGDGGTGKSYEALYLAGELANRGMRIGFFDWELCGDDHRERLECLFGPTMPRIFYARCERPLVYEADRLRRIATENRLDFAMYDSIAFACDGPPESAEIASRYFRAVRQIGVGSLHVAHISKQEGADQKPFGSVYWHNGARSTWFVEAAEGTRDTDTLTIGLFNRKANLGRLRPPIGFKITFGTGRTTFERTDVADDGDLAAHMSTRERMKHVLRRGPLPLQKVAELLDKEPDNIRRTANRYKHTFIVIEGGRVALTAKESA